MHFNKYNVSVSCFNVTACKVLYDNDYLIDHGPGVASSELKAGSPLPPPTFTHLSIANFPRPAVATWVSQDGSVHSEKIDTGAIFADRRIRHAAPPELIAKDTPSGTPIIYIVINDRTVYVYMISSVYLSEREDPSDRFSNVRDETILAYSRKY